MRVLVIIVTTAFISASFHSCSTPQKNKYDVVIYGGTSAGIAAAIQTSRMGSSVVILEPGGRLGGLTTGGLGQTDIGNKQAIGGIAREFYRNVRAYYELDSNWKWQSREEYRDGGQTRTETERNRRGHR